MEKSSVEFEYVKADKSSRPELIEDTRQPFTSFARDQENTLIAIHVTWDFKSYDTMSNNKLIIDAKTHQQVVLYNSEDFGFIDASNIITESHDRSTEIIRIELKKLSVSHQIPPLTEDIVKRYSDQLLDAIQKRRS